MKTKLAAILLSAFMSAALSNAASAQESTLDVVKSRGKLIAGVVPDYPPFGQVNESGELVGFDADVAAYIAKKLEVELELRPVSTADRIPMLVNGNIDVDVAAFTITQKRTEAIDFSVPYMVMGSGMLMPADSGITRYHDLGEKTVSFTQGTPYADSVRKDLPSAKIVQFQDTAQGYLAVLNGKVDAFLDDAAPLYDFASKHSDKLKVIEVEGSQAPMGLAVHQNDSKWRQFVDVALIQMWEDGSYAATYRKWFKADPPAGFAIPAYRWYGWGQ